MSFNLVKYIAKLANEFDCTITYYVAYQINDYLRIFVDCVYKLFKLFVCRNIINLKTAVHNVLPFELSAYSQLAIYDFYKNSYNHIIPTKILKPVFLNDELTVYMSLIVEFLCCELLQNGQQQMKSRKSISSKNRYRIATIDMYNGLYNDPQFTILSTKLNVQFQKNKSSLNIT